MFLQHGLNPDLNGIVKTNSIALGTDAVTGFSSPHGALFPLVCRLNHACRPNARYVWREDLGKELVFAMRPIAKGEEITISYIGKYANLAVRQKELYERFNFTCSCAMCTEHTVQQDICMSEIQELYEKVPYLSLIHI